MIRAPNQFSPKTKVVDLSFLYNFYFGQISSCYMKFGVSVNQNRVKIFKCDHCALQCFSCAAPTPYRRCGRRRALHASAVTMSDRQATRAYHSGAVSGFASPFSFLALAWSQGELEERKGLRWTGSFQACARRRAASSAIADAWKLAGVQTPTPVWASQCRAQESTVNSFESIWLEFDPLKPKFWYRNLKFGQNKSCRGKEDLQLSFWAKVDLRLGSRRKTQSNTAKTKVTMQTRLALMMVISLN